VFFTDQAKSVGFVGDVATQAAGTFAQPRYKMQGNIGYSLGPFDTDWQVLYRSKSKYNLSQTFVDTPINDLPSYMLLNASVGMRIGDHASVQLAVNNVLDKAPPYSAVGHLSTNVFDFLGRRLA